MIQGQSRRPGGDGKFLLRRQRGAYLRRGQDLRRGAGWRLRCSCGADLRHGAAPRLLHKFKAVCVHWHVEFVRSNGRLMHGVQLERF